MLTSDVPENREVVDGGGFTFQRGSAADLADRLRFLIANPAVRQAAGGTAKRRIAEHYQWHKIALDIESAYFQLMGWESAAVTAKKPIAQVVVTGDTEVRERRAG